jgi:hypothetical protein
MKKIIWTFEKEEDFETFYQEMINIPSKNGFVESEDEESVNVTIVSINDK